METRNLSAQKQCLTVSDGLQVLGYCCSVNSRLELSTFIIYFDCPSDRTILATGIADKVTWKILLEFARFRKGNFKVSWQEKAVLDLQRLGHDWRVFSRLFQSSGVKGTSSLSNTRVLVLIFQRNLNKCTFSI